MFCGLLGHTEVETTGRYAHLAEDSVKELVVRISDINAGDLLGDYVAGLMTGRKSPIHSRDGSGIATRVADCRRMMPRAVKALGAVAWKNSRDWRFPSCPA